MLLSKTHKAFFIVKTACNGGYNFHKQLKTSLFNFYFSKGHLMTHHSKLIPLGAILALAAAGAFAQTPAPTITPSATPEAVGVSPQTAAEANQKAVPRSDTATLVRTSPSATDQAKSTMDNTSTSTTTTSSADTMPMKRTVKATPMRRARADRN